MHELGKDMRADRAAFGSFEPVSLRMRALFLNPTIIHVCRPALCYES